ncbi:MAG: hypothetical protein R2748_23660 [Bryobacterales bacterium]
MSDPPDAETVADASEVRASAHSRVMFFWETLRPAVTAIARPAVAVSGI